ncbi:hypothetical protein BSPLISOX_1482, partial [uncultured Gammaproteobacteria bacterium]
AEIAPNVNWPKSQSFVHVDEQGNLSPALTEQFLPARTALLADYWQKTVKKWRFSEVNASSPVFARDLVALNMSKEDSNPNTCWIHYSSTNSTSAEKLIPVDCKFVSIDPGILTIYNMDTDESCIGKVYTSGNRSNMHLGQIFVLGEYRLGDLYSGKMTNVNGKLELNLTTSDYSHPPETIDAEVAKVNDANIKDIVLIARGHDGHWTTFYHGTVNIEICSMFLTIDDDPYASKEDPDDPAGVLTISNIYNMDTDESCIGKVYISGDRSNMHLGQIFVLGEYRLDDLYSGKMTNVNGKLELNLTTSDYSHPPETIDAEVAKVNDANIKDIVLIARGHDGHWTTFYHGTVNSELCSMYLTVGR